MKARRRAWVTVCGAATALVLWFAAPPISWFGVEQWMPRNEIIRRCGAPAWDNNDVKGTFWFAERVVGRYELWVSFDSHGTASAFSVKVFVGTPRTYWHRVLWSRGP
jgi:hypothetical protein